MKWSGWRDDWSGGSTRYEKRLKRRPTFNGIKAALQAFHIIATFVELTLQRLIRDILLTNLAQPVPPMNILRHCYRQTWALRFQRLAILRVISSVTSHHCTETNAFPLCHQPLNVSTYLSESGTKSTEISSFDFTWSNACSRQFHPSLFAFFRPVSKNKALFPFWSHHQQLAILNEYPSELINVNFIRR